MSNNSEIVTTPSRQVLINEQSLRDTAYAIRERENRPVKLKPSQFSKEIFSQIYNVIGGDRTEEIDLSVEENDVNFYDYDGTRVYSYSAAEFLNKNSMPENPSHDNLVAQGWNWSLSDAKDYVQNYGILNVGQMYNTKMDNDTGCLEIDIQLKEGYLSPVFSIGCSTNSFFDIYWGDDSESSISNTGSSVTSSHTYSSPGKYTIIVNTMDGYNDLANYSITGTIYSGSNLLTGGGTDDNIYRNCITAVRVGSCVKSLGDYAFNRCSSLKTITLHKDLESFGSSIFQECTTLKAIVIPNISTSIQTYSFASCYGLKTVILSNTITSINSWPFQNCYSLKTIIIPDSITSIGNYTFYYCPFLKSITIPNTVTSIGQNAFNYCFSLKTVTIPNIVTSIGRTAFQSCYSLKTVTIPNTVTSIGQQAFYYCYSVTSYHLKSIVPPTLGSNAFYSIPAETKIYVPWSRDHSVYQTYLTASGWSSLSDHIVEEDQTTAQAYAVFDSSDGSLTFFRDTAGKYTNNQTSGTKTYYTGIETRTGSDNSNAPWYSNRTSVESVTFENLIAPKSTAWWFFGMNNTNFTSITGFNKLDTSNVADMNRMFDGCQNLTNLDVSYFDTSNVTNMNQMFLGCRNLTSLDVSHFDTSNVTDMGFMFSSCRNLTSLDVSHFDTSNVTNMEYMFNYCQNLTSLNVSHLDTSNVTNMEYMFYFCQSLTSLDVSHFDTGDVTNMSRMFYQCSSLITIYVSDKWTTENVTSSTNMFYTCTNLVGGEGTIYNSSYVDKTYARIDASGTPGYLTYKAAPVGGAS